MGAGEALETDLAEVHHVHPIFDQVLVDILSWEIIKFFVVLLLWFLLLTFATIRTFEHKLLVLQNGRLRTRPELLVLLLALENLRVSFGF